MHRASYCNVYIGRPTFFEGVYHNWYKLVRMAVQPDVPAYTNCDIQLQNVAPDDGLKSPKHVEHLMINKDTL